MNGFFLTFSASAVRYPDFFTAETQSSQRLNLERLRLGA
jgi:hypothetical protein